MMMMLMMVMMVMMVLMMMMRRRKRRRTSVNPIFINDVRIHPSSKFPLHRPLQEGSFPLRDCPVGGQPCDILEACQNIVSRTSTPRVNLIAASWQT
eukprot:6815286-Pyramimonas_sp.AAC.1